MATLIGDGAHARDILATINLRDERRYPYKQISHHSQWDGDGVVLIAINDPRTRAKVAAELGVDDESWVHPTAQFGPDVQWGVGTHINYAVSMTRTRLGEHVTVSPGVTICGDVAIGNRCLIGAGTTICDRVTIGDDVTVGAGAVILPETVIIDGETWVGVPARLLRTRPRVNLPT